MDLSLPKCIVDTLPKQASTSTGKGAAIANQFFSSRVIQNRKDCLVSRHDHLLLGSSDPTMRGLPRQSKPEYRMEHRRLTHRQSKRQAIHKVPEIAPELCRQLLSMWRQYFTSFVNFHEIDNSTNERHKTLIALQELPTIDLTGCPVRVIRAKNPSLLDLSGIIVTETQNTFRLGNLETGKMHMIPKMGSDLEVQIEEDGIHFVIFASQMMFRTADRATKKWRVSQKPEADFETLMNIP